MKQLLQTLFFFLMVTQICFGQWVQVGLNNESIKDIAVKDANIFAVTEDNKLYRSTDNGANYTMIVESTFNVTISQTGKVFISKDGYMGDNIFTSSDNGANWMLLNIVEQIQDSLYVQFYGFTKITVSSTGIIFCTLRVGIWWEQWGSDLISKSNDDGLTWTTPGIGIIGGNLFDFRNQYCITIGFKHQAYVDPDHFIHLTSDNGNTWNYLGRMPVPSPFINSIPNVLGLFSSGNILVGGTIMDSTGLNHPRIFLSTDMCSNWTQISTLNSKVGVSLSSGSTEGMLVGTDSLGVFLFSDEGDSLGSRNDGLTNLNIQTLTLDNNGYVYAGTENGVWRRPLSEIIPVELTSFIVTSNGEEVILSWTTATELNNYGFEIQRRALGGAFATVAFVKGQGTTTQQNQYSFADKNLDEGKYFYRLKQIDYGGQYSYSQTVEVDVRTLDNYSLEQNYPNPFNPTTTIGYVLQEKGNARLTLLNSLGEEIAVLVNEEQDKGYHKVELNGAKLSSGVYFYQLLVSALQSKDGKAGAFVETKKMLLLR